MNRTREMSRFGMLAVVAAALMLSGCSSLLGILAWDEWFNDDDPAAYRVFIDGYDVGAAPTANGLLNLAGLSEGDYLITVANIATKRRGLHAAMHVQPGALTSLRHLNPFQGGVITGTVRRDGAAGPAMPDVRVIAVKDGATLLAGGSGAIAIPQPAGTTIETMMAYTDNSGNYRLGPATFGDWLVTAAVAGCQCDAKHVNVQSGADKYAALALSEDVGAVTGIVRGTVTSAAGALLRNPLVTAELAGPFAPPIPEATRTQVATDAGVVMPGGAWFHWYTLTDIGTTAGEYILDTPAGTHAVEAYKHFWRAMTAEVTVTAGSVSTQDFALPAAG